MDRNRKGRGERERESESESERESERERERERERHALNGPDWSQTRARVRPQSIWYTIYPVSHLHQSF